ncbi:MULTISPECIES: PilZ domain-containing protein [unclassified Halobacteriovorax]|uniref:PilZ domain-containing protein n=1 Tax=unclassified Halobacteriovorax TaxID=2639665 RepID=UPI000EA3233B|nr:PilZ domain-containing protein [Halobacteriovorax sp. BALOs_7]AYF43811.1 hypothetical protein BALOs_0801 [Halobacteriovorax sp. BALOs_7]
MKKHSRDFQRYPFESYKIVAYTIKDNKRVQVKLMNISLGGCLIKTNLSENIDNLYLHLADKQIKMELNQVWIQSDGDHKLIGFKIKFNDYYNFNLWKSLVHSTQRIEEKYKEKYNKKKKEIRDVSL